MAEGMEIFFKKINLLPSLNNLLENDTKKDTLKSLLKLSQFELFSTPPPKVQECNPWKNSQSIFDVVIF